MSAGYRNYSSRARLIAQALDVLALPAAPLLRLAAPKGDAPAVPRSILAVRLDHLGDVLLTTPALRALRSAFPQARIDVLAAPWGAAALEGNTDIDRVLEGTAPWYDPRHGGVPDPKAVLRVASLLRSEGGYDWAFDFRGDPRIVLCTLLPAARHRFGFSGLGLERLLTDSIPYDRRRSMLDLCLDLVAAAGAPSVGRRPVYRTDEAARERVRSLLAEHRIAPGAPVAVVAPGGNRAPARWDPLSFARVCEELAASELHVALVGRAEDAPVTREVARACGRTLLDLTGRTSLRQLAALLETAVLLVGNDSGPAHLAAAVGCPVVAVFGPTDPALTFPYEDGVRFVSVSRPIDHDRPCFRAGCAGDHGFSRILPEEVVALARRVARPVPRVGERA